MKLYIFAGIACLGSGVVLSAQTTSIDESAPLYRVTVLQRSVKAVNYRYRAEPTEIDFRGTVLLPQGKGSAWVQSKQGRTDIDANFERMATSQRYGREYLTYVLWAISPEGRPHNLGEVVLSGSGKSHLHVTTELQAFAMIITAEPYAAVRTPSDVVVTENQIRPDTVGKIESVDAKYELLPRGEYTWQISEELNRELANAPKVSPAEYDAMLQLYETQNAIGIAREAGAEQYAPNSFNKAQQLLASAQSWSGKKGGEHHVVEYAREAAQTAEDARVIAQQRQEQARVGAASAVAAALDATADAEVATAVADKQKAEAEAQQARYDAESAQQRAEAERQARLRAEADAAAARNQIAPRPAPVAARPSSPAPPQTLNNLDTRAMRMRVFEALNAGLEVRDTPRGLIVTLPAAAFNGDRLVSSEKAAMVAVVLERFQGLHVSCEGYTSDDNSEVSSRQRANAVREALIQGGLPLPQVSAVGYGNTRPLGPNTTPEGRWNNSRVEIVITGDVIGTLPFWDKTYSLDGEGSR